MPTSQVTACPSSPLQHLSNYLHVLPILPAPGGLLGPHDVRETRRQQLIAVEREMHRVAGEVVVAFRTSRLEGDVEPSRSCDQVPAIAARQHLWTTVEEQ